MTTVVDFGPGMGNYEVPFDFNPCPLCGHQVYVGPIDFSDIGVGCIDCRLSITGLMPGRHRPARRGNQYLRCIFRLWQKWQRLSAIEEVSEKPSGFKEWSLTVQSFAD